MKVIILSKKMSADAEALSSALRRRGHTVKTLYSARKSEIKAFIAAEKPDIVHVIGNRGIIRDIRSVSDAKAVYTDDGSRSFPFLPKYDAEYAFPKIICPMAEKNDVRRAEIRSVIGLKDEFTFLAIGDAEPMSDIKTFVVAAAEASRSCPTLKFLVSGSGSTLKSLKVLCSELDIMDKVIFLPKNIGYSDAVEAADIAVSSSVAPSDIICSAKALGLGIPLILAEKCEAHLTQISGKAGLTFDDGNSEMLATAMLALYENKSLYSRMSENAEGLFGKKFSADAASEKLEGLYLSCAGAKKERNNQSNV